MPGRDAGDVFTIDLARCTGCFTCVIACKDRAGVPDDLDWLWVERAEGGRFPAVQLTFRPMHCFHCTEAPCFGVCPVDAIGRVGQWVQIDPGLCTGCGACVASCPFGTISIDPGGRATKCDGCADEVASGIGPTCVRACPMRALYYGPASELSRPRVIDPGWDDRGIGPRVRYLVRPPDGEE
ncbi:MAG: 4Fe-4S binding protein [Chloroflexi bacterium]|nr:4Fe-4S binding protein [Chloroflexota bacterium]